MTQSVFQTHIFNLAKDERVYQSLMNIYLLVPNQRNVYYIELETIDQTRLDLIALSQTLELLGSANAQCGRTD